jgi:hypothetical protein
MKIRRPMRGFSGRRRAAAVLGVTVMALATSGLAFASVPSSDVVPPSGSVAGGDYAYWLKQAWGFYYSSPGGPGACQTVSSHGATMTLAEDISGGKSSCTVPAGQPVFVNEAGKECSAIPGHHNGYGTSTSALQQCARAGIETVLISIYVDGKRSPSDFGKYYWKPTKAFTAQVAANRFPGYHKSSTEAAAWGWSLMFKQLPKGTHKIVCNARSRKTKKTVFTSQVTLHVS